MAWHNSQNVSFSSLPGAGSSSARGDVPATSHGSEEVVRPLNTTNDTLTNVGGKHLSYDELVVSLLLLLRRIQHTGFRCLLLLLLLLLERIQYTGFRCLFGGQGLGKH